MLYRGPVPLLAGRIEKVTPLNLLLLLVLAFFYPCLSSAAETATVTLAWDPSPSPGVVAYRVYYGTASGNYSQFVEVTNATTADVSALRFGTTYFFAATALDFTGLESEFSEEINYMPLAPYRPVLRLSVDAGQPVAITASGSPGEAYRLEASSDLISWTSLGTAVADSTSRVAFLDPAAATLPRRFYRVARVSPAAASGP